MTFHYKRKNVIIFFKMTYGIYVFELKTHRQCVNVVCTFEVTNNLPKNSMISDVFREASTPEVKIVYILYTYYC